MKGEKFLTKTLLHALQKLLIRSLCFCGDFLCLNQIVFFTCKSEIKAAEEPPAVTPVCFNVCNMQDSEHFALISKLTALLLLLKEFVN